jgi:hypothetical protein
MAKMFIAQPPDSGACKDQQRAASEPGLIRALLSRTYPGMACSEVQALIRWLEQQPTLPRQMWSVVSCWNPTHDRSESFAVFCHPFIKLAVDLTISAWPKIAQAGFLKRTRAVWNALLNITTRMEQFTHYAARRSD